MYNKKVKYRQSFPIIFKNFPKLCNEYLVFWLVTFKTDGFDRLFFPFPFYFVLVGVFLALI